MVRAILAGTKTQTRRAVHSDLISGAPEGGSIMHRCPYGQPGDQIWVRETGWERPVRSALALREGADTWARYYYDADGLSESDHEQFKAWGFKRRPSIHMPRSACRITLEITGLGIERLQEIGQDDARAEGITDGGCLNCGNSEADCGCLNPKPDPRDAFVRLWESINGPGSWAKDPLVWVVKFRKV